MSLCIRPAKEQDLEAADPLLRKAFERGASFLPHLQLQFSIQPDLFLVAEQDGELVGTVGAVDYPAANDRGGSTAYLGLMAVDPAQQRRGIARRLVEQLLAELDARGCERILLDATDQGAPLYEQLGFVDDGRARVVELQTMTVVEPPRVDLNISTHADLAELAAFDALAFGSSRVKLLTRLIELYRGRLLVARSSHGRLMGYLFARDPTLGPWICESAAVATALLAAALRLNFSQPPHVLIPRSNSMAADLLLTCGFTEQRSLRHMRRGMNGPVGEQAKLFGQSSFAHG